MQFFKGFPNDVYVIDVSEENLTVRVGVIRTTVFKAATLEFICASI